MSSSHANAPPEHVSYTCMEIIMAPSSKNINNGPRDVPGRGPLGTYVLLPVDMTSQRPTGESTHRDGPTDMNIYHQRPVGTRKRNYNLSPQSRGSKPSETDFVHSAKTCDVLMRVCVDRRMYLR